MNRIALARYHERMKDPEFREAQRRRSRAKTGGKPTPSRYRHEYDALLIECDGRCPICHRTPDEFGRKGTFHIDHDHATGKVRGLLCPLCNPLLGLARDDPDVLREAIKYLARYSE